VGGQHYVSLCTLRLGGNPTIARLASEDGFLGRKAVVDVTVVDQAAHQLVQIGIGLGVGRPELAIHLLADAFQGRNWSTDSVTELLDSLDPNQLVVANPEQQPWMAISLPYYGEHGQKFDPMGMAGGAENSGALCRNICARSHLGIAPSKRGSEYP
jgi:hypothetical protein